MHNDPLLAERLVEYELGLLEDPQRQELAARLTAEPALAGAHDAVRRILRPVAAWEAPVPPGDLVDRIMQQVQATTPLEYVAATSPIGRMGPIGHISDDGPRTRPMFSLGELVALAACIFLVLSVFTPGMMSARSRQLQTLCANNIAGLGRGLFSYAADHNGSLPRTRQSQPVNWIRQPNRTHLGPAIRLRFIAPRSLFCPTSPTAGTADDVASNEQAMLRFLQRTGLRFYSVQNANGPSLRITTRPSLPLAADANPMFANGRFHPDLDWKSNSRAHDNRGQNVLYLDGSNRFLRQPVIAPGSTSADNIWKVEDISDYTGSESRHSATDTFLTP